MNKKQIRATMTMVYINYQTNKICTEQNATYRCKLMASIFNPTSMVPALSATIPEVHALQEDIVQA
jgi:hypothetical protein